MAPKAQAPIRNAADRQSLWVEDGPMRQGLLIFFLLVGLAPISRPEGNGPFIEPGGGIPSMDAEGIRQPDVQHGPLIEPGGNS